MGETLQDRHADPLPAAGPRTTAGGLGDGAALDVADGWIMAVTAGACWWAGERW